jgi:hypothetical protein
MLKLMVVFLILAGGAEPLVTKPVVEPAECDSCTARHKALKRLQDARITPPNSQTKGNKTGQPKPADE